MAISGRHCRPVQAVEETYTPIASVAALTAQPLAALPPYGCGVPLAGSERHAGWQHAPHGFCGMRPPSLSLRGAKRRGNLGKAVTFSPEPACDSAVYCEIATAPLGPRNDNLEAITILTIASSDRQRNAGSGMPLPYNSPPHNVRIDFSPCVCYTFSENQKETEVLLWIRKLLPPCSSRT